VSPERLARAQVRLQAVFDDIAATRMQGLPILNPALAVELVGLRAWQGCALGVLVTPWTINLVLLADAEGPAALPVLPLGAEQIWQFPSGAYAFMGFQDERLGPCQLCPLISPVHELGSQAEALALADEVLALLLAPLAGPVGADAAAGSARAGGSSIATGPAARARSPVPSRRAFLRAVVPGR